MQPKSKPTAWTSDLFSIGGTITKTYKHPSVTEGACRWHAASGRRGCQG